VRPISPARSVLLQKKCACGPGSSSGECEACQRREREQHQQEEKKKEERKGQTVQRAAAGRAPAVATAPPIVGSVLNSPGRSLDASTRSFIEPRFGRDFSSVRVHTGPQAAESARAVNAHAYTVGQDIVFDHGKYDPGSQSGRQLLAHELAHTVQQHGLQRSAEGVSLGESSEYHHLEREADSVAHAVMSGSSVPVLATRPARPLVSRATATSKPPVKEDEKKRNWQPATPQLAGAGVQQYALPPTGTKSGLVAVQMKDALNLPKEKGPVQDIWQERADAGALEAIMVAGEDIPRTKAGLKQERPPTTTLREIWRAKVKWNATDAPANWKAAGGDSADYDKPQAGGKTCQVDHILELQFGGNNVPANMQMLDGQENMQSGRDIFQALRKTADAVSAALATDDATKELGKQADILIHYDKVVQPDPTCKACCSVEKVAMDAAQNPEVAKAKNIKVIGAGESIGGQKGTTYPIQSASSSALIFVTDEKENPVPILKSEVPENKYASTIIAGLSLMEWHRSPKTGGTIDAVIDAGEKGRLPVALTKGDKVTLNRANDAKGTLTLGKGPAEIPFTFGPLSPGAFTKLHIEPDGSLSGTGYINPTIPFLPKLNVKFDKDSFALVAPLDAKKLKPPIPGAKITEGEFGLQLAPQFKPYGALAFELARGPKKFLDGRLDVSADTQGLVAKGVLHAYLPGIDKAEGTITYQNHEWTGGIDIEAGQLKNKLKYVQSGSAKIGLSSKGVSAEGKFILDIPKTDGITAQLFFENNRWLLRGSGKFKPPKLEETEITVEYDGNHIYGIAQTGFKLYGFTGKIKVQYRDEKLSGEGDIIFKKGRASGKLHVKMSPEHKFSGSGELTYQITENLVGTAGIEIDEKEKVHLKGVLEFTKPLHFMDPAKGDYEIFHFEVDIPIPGLSIPKVGGINAVIKGGLFAGYQIGPGEIRNLKAKAEFDPFEDKPDLDITLSGEVHISASAHITGTINGGVKLSILVASVSGGIGIAASATLKGEASSNIELHYHQGKFEAQADFKVLLDLILSLVICAWVHAEAGVWKFKVETTKVWNLKSFRYDSGLKLGMSLKKPLRYVSGEGVSLPSLSDIDWITPKVDTSDLLGRIFGSQDPSPDENVDGAQECGR
jgi:hypothetical protein